LRFAILDLRFAIEAATREATLPAARCPLNMAKSKGESLLPMQRNATDCNQISIRERRCDDPDDPE
jgi:hypothetical protein